MNQSRPSYKQGTPFKKRGSSHIYKKGTYDKHRNEHTRKPFDLVDVKKKQPIEHKGIRLNRFIANAGICSRRKADEFISAGMVTVNGKVVDTLGFRVQESDKVRYGGQLLTSKVLTYVLLNKPKDYITTNSDPKGRKTVLELLPRNMNKHLFPVGRLDRNTSGLLLLTNDGELSKRLSHPSYNITKIYHVVLHKNLKQGDFNKIVYGLELEDGFIKPDEISYVTGANRNEIGITLHSGKNRIVRRIFEHLDYEVKKLDRVIYANLTKKNLPRGRYRTLTEVEIAQLRKMVGIK